MQCKSCNTELPKHAKVCPKCGTMVSDKGPQYLKVVAIAGAVIAFIGGMLPFIQNTEDIETAYSFMNIQMSFFWYLFMAALIATILLCVARKEKFSIITTAIAGVIFAVSMFVSPFLEYAGRQQSAGGDVVNKYKEVMLSDLLSSGGYTLGLGFYVVIIGLVVAVIGVFFDLLKYFKKEINAEAKKYMTNSINKSVWSMIYYYRWFYVMFLPALVFVLIFNYWPMLGLRYAFTSYKISNPYYIGIAHFHEMATADIYFWTAFKNTLYLSIIKLILNTGAAVIISLLLHEISNIIFKKTVQTIIYLPHFMSWVVTASLFRLILAPSSSGMVNTFLAQLGMFGGNPSNGIFFLGDTRYWVGSYFVINVWKDTGWGTILFLATLSGISPELYEAADIDGANRFNKMRYITLPALANTIITVFILNLAKVMNLFESVFVLMNDAVYDVSNVLQTFVYYKTFGGGRPDYGYTTAVGLFRSVVSGLLVIICNYASKKVRGRGIV